MAEEARYERRRARGHYRKDPADVDIHKHQPTPEDRRVETPLQHEEQS